MEKRIVLRGALWGGLGGLLAFVFARILAEPIIQRAIDYEGARDEAQHMLDQAAGIAVHEEHGEVFTRSIQANVGIGFGMILFGIAMGALFAVAYCVAYGRFSNLRPGTLAVLLAGAMFFSLYLVPFLKYPANPPSIGHGETIGARTGLYLLMVVASVAALVLAVWLGRRLQSRFGAYSAALLAGGGFIVVIAVVMVLLPSLGHLSANADYGNFATETPQPLSDPQGHIVIGGFSADDLYMFRLYSVGAQVILWATIGLGFAPMANKLLGDVPRKRDHVAT
jgi:Probable cobalt transporter subunit (CbtA)